MAHLCSGRLLIGVLLAGINTTVVAERQASPEKTFYLGYRAGSAVTSVDFDTSRFSADRGLEFSQGGLVGYQFAPAWAVQAFWQDAGKTEVISRDSGATVGLADLRLRGAALAYSYAYLPELDVFAEAGLASLSRKFRFVDAQDERDTTPLAGAGVRWSPIKGWQLRADVTAYGEDLLVTTVGIVKHFWPGGQKALPPVVKQSALSPGAERSMPLPACANFTVFFDGIEFASGSAALSEAAQTQLDNLAEQLKALPPGVLIEVHASADQTGTASYNYALSVTRARTVRDYLGARGIALSRIAALGYGEWKAADESATVTSNHNRRAELVLVGVEKYVDESLHCEPLVRPASSASQTRSVF